VLTSRDMGTRGAKQRGLEAPPDDITQTVREFGTITLATCRGSA
jgi:hypothetical protein